LRAKPKLRPREITALLSQKLSATISSAKLAPALPLETNCKLPLVREFYAASAEETHRRGHIL